MSDHFRNLNRIEFVMTLMCTGKCKHCSEGDHESCVGHIDGDVGARVVRTLCEKYDIKSLMTFGGEPLLFPEDTFKIHKAATDMKIPKRDIITNGFFSRDEKRIKDVAEKTAESGVTKVMLSVDAFHQETIPLSYVKIFAEALLQNNVNVVSHPAWLVSKEDCNPYNIKTGEFLSEFSNMGISVSKGNIIFPSGNALKYLGEYFDENKEYINPYEESHDDVHTVSIDFDGSTLDGNIYQSDILEIISKYSEK